ncbi:MAG TPA: hypothetical protein VGX03_38990 [Candidatus Binatia bacterium]|jgi:hypothetical protein|nr:hypothetical protein [Candidatus Binatia bacterium]
MKLSPADIEREVRYVYGCLSTDEFVSAEPRGKIDATCKELIRDFEIIARHTRPLRPTEHGIVTLTRQRTAALLADRVWGADTAVDLGIAFGWELPIEVRLRAIVKLIQLFERAPTAPRSGPASPRDVDAFVADVERDLALGFHSATDATVLPLYSSSSRRDSQYRSGDQAALICIVEDLKIVDEEQLTWAQVAEFRRDKEARAAYRRFIHWLDRDMVDRSVEYITDEVAQRLERYEWSLQKHGIETLIGSLSNTLNPQSLISTSTAGLAVDLIAGKPIWSLLTAGGLLLGHAALSVATALVERRDIEMAHREISYVQQLKTDLGRAE